MAVYSRGFMAMPIVICGTMNSCGQTELREMGGHWPLHNGNAPGSTWTPCGSLCSLKHKPTMSFGKLQWYHLPRQLESCQFLAWHLHETGVITNVFNGHLETLNRHLKGTHTWDTAVYGYRFVMCLMGSLSICRYTASCTDIGGHTWSTGSMADLQQ